MTSFSFLRSSVAGLGVLLAAILPADPAAAQSPGLDCLLEPAQTVEIGSVVTGLLKSVDVKRGGHVTAGQTIARLHDEVEAANLTFAQMQGESREGLLAAQTRLKLAQTAYDRSAKLADSGTVTRQAPSPLTNSCLIHSKSTYIS